MREETAEACLGMVLRPSKKARVSFSTRGNLFELLRLFGVCPLKYRGDTEHHDESVYIMTFKIRRKPLLLWQCGFLLQLKVIIMANDIEVLKEKINSDKEISVPISVLENVCRYCEYYAIYDKLTKFDDFYYKIKKLLQ